MNVDPLSPDARAVIRRVLAFISTTPYFDTDFETRLGVTRGEFAAVLMRWPAVDDRADDARVALAINNALNEVVNGLALSAEDWHRLGAIQAQVKAASAEWAARREGHSSDRP